MFVVNNIFYMSFISEFQKFAIKGNVMDLAVGVIIGGAFGKIIDSVIKDLILPIVSGLFGQPDFSHLYFSFKPGAAANATLEEAQSIGPVLAYGNFITVLINFFLLAIAVFVMVKAMNQLRKKQEEAPAAPAPPSSTDQLLMEIRDSLKK
jgi:large conductance mechanosensitive channel